MSKNRSDLITQALTNLGIIASGQSVSDDLVTKMDGVVDPAVAMLAALGIYYVQDAGEAGPPTGGEIEDAAFLPLADYIANAACAAFNLPADQKMQALSMIAESKLITLSAPSRTLKTLRVDPALQGRRFAVYRGGFLN